MAYLQGEAVMRNPKLSPDLTATERWVGAWLFGEMWGDKRGWKPLQRSVTTIARGCGRSEATARNALHRLVALGYITQHAERLSDRSHAASIWTPGPRAGGPGLAQLNGGGGPTISPGGPDAKAEDGLAPSPFERSAPKRPETRSRALPATERRSLARLRSSDRRSSEPKKAGESLGELIALWKQEEEP